MKRVCAECGGSGNVCAPGPGEEGEPIQCAGCWGWGAIEREEGDDDEAGATEGTGELPR